MLAFFPGSGSRQEGHGRPDHDGFWHLFPTCNPPFSGLTGLPLLCCYVPVRTSSAVLVPQRSTSVPDQEASTTSVLLTIAGTGTSPSQRTCFPPISRLQSRCFPCLLHPTVVDYKCATGTRSRRRTYYVRCLLLQTLHGILAIVADPCSHVPLSGNVRHAGHAGSPHTTRRNHMRCDAAVPPARHAGARSPIPRAGFSSEDQVRREGGQAETPARDRQGQMQTDHLVVRKWQRVSDRQGDHLFYLRRVFPGGCVQGATDGSMPVGSAATIYVIFKS